MAKRFIKRLGDCKKCAKDKRGRKCGPCSKMTGMGMSRSQDLDNSLYDSEGRNKNGIRYDKDGKRIW